MRENKRKHSEEVLALYRSLRKTILLMLTTVFTLVVVTVAWFANNNTVSGFGVDIVGSNQMGFELKSEGNEINSVLKEYLTDNSSLTWLLSQKSNLENYGEDPTGISPGSAGSLSFYVIPDSDGAFTINCTLDIQPVLKGSNQESDTLATVEKLLRGHLLFAYRYNSGENETTGLVDMKNGDFQIILSENTVAKQQQKVTLDWFWPYTLNEANHHEQYGKAISDMTTNQDYSEYFYYDSTTSSAVEVTSEFKILNNHYNEADQMIGDKVKAVVLKLTADLAS